MEHRELRAQDEDLDVLGGVAAQAQRHPGQLLREQLVDQLQRHLRIMSGWLGLRSSRSTAVSTISGTNSLGGVEQCGLVGVVEDRSRSAHRAGTNAGPLWGGRLPTGGGC